MAWNAAVLRRIQDHIHPTAGAFQFNAQNGSAVHIAGVIDRDLERRVERVLGRGLHTEEWRAVHQAPVRRDFDAPGRGVTGIVGVENPNRAFRPERPSLISIRNPPLRTTHRRSGVLRTARVACGLCVPEELSGGVAGATGAWQVARGGVGHDLVGLARRDGRRHGERDGVCTVDAGSLRVGHDRRALDQPGRDALQQDRLVRPGRHELPN